MRINFLGTGSAIPSAGNGFTSFLAEGAGSLVLVDTGDNAVRSLLEVGEDPFSLDALVLTHAHADHLGSLPAFVAALDCMRRQKPLTLVAAPWMEPIATSLMAAFDIIPGKLPFELRFASSWDSGGLRVDLLEGHHSVPTVMPLFSEGGRARLLYTSDIQYRPGQLVGRSGSCATLIHEATYPHDRLPSVTGHSSARQAGLAAREIGAESLFLCHFQETSFSAGFDPAAEAAGAFGGRTIAPKLLAWYEVA